MEKLVLVGGGPFAKCTINYIEDEEKYEIVGYTDLEDNGDILGSISARTRKCCLSSLQKV